MTVHFVGAGPGDPDLLTVRARRLLETCPVCLHAGSVVARPILSLCRPGARVVDTAPLDLDAIIDRMAEADRADEDVVRLHSGDLSIWSTLGEQTARLDALGIGWTVTPGVPAFAAAAAALGSEFTRPGIAQSVVLTRLTGRATPVAATERLETFAATGATLAIHLSVDRLAEIVARLAPVLGADCPLAVVERASRPDERRWTATLGTIEAVIGADAPPRLALVLIGRALGADAAGRRSALYDPAYRRRFRP